MAPLVVRNKVFVGNSGGELGVRGWLTAVDATDGKILWRAWSTGSDADCLIGEHFKPFYEMDRGKDLGITSWPPNRWQIGGGTVWGWVTYDPDLNLIYYGTGNPGAWNPELRPRLHVGSRDGRGALRDGVHARDREQRRRSQNGLDDSERGEEADAWQDGARCLARRGGRERLAAVRVVAAHEPALHPAPAARDGYEGVEASYIEGTPYLG